MAIFCKRFTMLVWIKLVLSTIPGLSCMDLIRLKILSNKQPGEDPCNPLHWYPKTIPEYCYFKPSVTNTITEKSHSPMSLPVPVKLPIPDPRPLLRPLPKHLPGLSIPLSITSPPRPPSATPTALPPLYAQSPRVPNAQAVPLMAYGTNLQSHFPFSYSIYKPQTGLFPRLPDFVTENGGLNIMPFSEVYTDMLEGHKNKMVRKKLKLILNKYKYFPNFRKYLRLIE